METVSQQVSPRIQEVLLFIHNQANHKKKTSVAKQAKCVPALIFQMEQLDLQLIKLAAIVTDKTVVSKFILKTTARDFQVKEIQNFVEEDEEEPVHRKKPRHHPNGKENGGIANY